MKINILIVDDNSANLETLNFMIKDIEFKKEFQIEILQATNGNEALSLAMKHEIALIILDIQMPQMDGFEVAKYLKKTKKTQDIPICFLTAAFKSQQMRVYGLHLGAFDYFFKPIDPLILVPKIKLYINFYAINKELKDTNKNLEKKIQNAIEKHSKIETKLHQSEKLASMVEMIGNIAHQWRQPLSVISTAATGVKMKKEYDILNDEFLIESMDTISSSADNLSKTIDELRDILNNDKGQIVNCYLYDIINRCLDIQKDTFSKNNIEIKINIDKKIQISSIPHDLIQAIINILNNSKDILITLKNNQEKMIFIDSKIKDEKIILIIKDNAGGVDKTIIGKIFEPYFTTKHQTQGAGLGLHITYQIIQQNLNGSIDLENETFTFNNKEYTGAKVIIELPLNDQENI
jgi:signal transduction histidine kinase